MADTKKETEKPRTGRKSAESKKPTWRKSTHGECPHPKLYNVVD